MANSVCPDCGKELTGFRHNGVSFLKCNCGYQKNLTTGKIDRLDTEKPNCVVQCTSCGGKNRIYYGDGGYDFSCNFCGTLNQFPKKPDPDLRSIVDCPHCKSKNRVPANRGKLNVTCGQCGGQFIFNSGTWPTAQSGIQPKQQTKAAPKTEPKAEPKTAPKQSAQAESRGGFFTGIKEFFREQTENAQNEVALVTGNVMNKTLGESFVRALSEFLPQISDYNYIEVFVEKTTCSAFLYWYEDGKRHSKLIKRLEYRPYYLNMKSLPGWENCYCEILSSKARKKVRDEIQEILLANYGFLYNLEGKRLVIMDHLL